MNENESQIQTQEQQHSVSEINDRYLKTDTKTDIPNTNINTNANINTNIKKMSNDLSLMDSIEISKKYAQIQHSYNYSKWKCTNLTAAVLFFIC